MSCALPISMRCATFSALPPFFLKYPQALNINIMLQNQVYANIYKYTHFKAIGGSGGHKNMSCLFCRTHCWLSFQRFLQNVKIQLGFQDMTNSICGGLDVESTTILTKMKTIDTITKKS